MALSPKPSNNFRKESKMRPRDETLWRNEVSPSLVVQMGDLPLPWTKEGCPKGYPDFRMTIKGSRFGSIWQGRIDLWWPHPIAPVPGQVVRAKQMEVRKLLGKVAHTPRERWDGLEQVDLETPGADEIEEWREYVQVAPAPEGRSPGPRQLVWEEAWKPEALPVTGEEWIWFREVSGHSRSFRTEGYGRLGIMIFGGRNHD